jgi:hypothetical protein
MLECWPAGKGLCEKVRVTNSDLLPIEKWRPLLELGSRGEDVRAWQRRLVDAGHDIGRSGADAIFGRQVQNATVAWQRARGLRGYEVTGTVGPTERGLLELDAGPIPFLGHALPSFERIPYIEAKHWKRGATSLKKWIVLHSMEIPEASTTAERCADYFNGMADGRVASAHACIDDDSIVQCVPWDGIAYHAPGANKWGIGLEHAGYARQTIQQWMDDYGLRMLRRSSWLCWQLCKRWGIPLRCLDARDLLTGDAGITTHAQVSLAFPPKTGAGHTDPGREFPLAYYLELCRRHRVNDPAP